MEGLGAAWSCLLISAQLVKFGMSLEGYLYLLFEMTPRTGGDGTNFCLYFVGFCSEKMLLL